MHHLPKHDAIGEIIRTGNGTINAHFWTDIQINVQGCLLQLKILVCDTQARTGILLSPMTLEQLQTWQDYGTNTMYIMALEHLQTWQDYGTNTMYIKQIAIPLYATQKHEILPGHKVIIKAILD